MSPEIGEILLTTSDRSVSQLVTTTLAADARFGSPHACRDLHDLASRLEHRPALVAIVDIDPQPAHMLPDLEVLAARFPETRFVLLTGSPTSDLMTEAMQIGARQLLGKAGIAAHLTGVLGRLAANGTARGVPLGRLYTVLPTTGGCGATTLAVNLANELRLAHPGGAVLLVDLDSSTGGAATALGAKADYGVADVLAHEGPPDPQLVRSTAVPCKEGLHVLLSPASANFASPAPLSYDNLARALTACRMAYPYTVVDAPHVPLAVAGCLAAASETLMILMQLTVRDIRLARQMRQALLQHGAAAERIRLLVNRYHKRYCSIGLEEARQALSTADLQVLANDYAAASRSLNLGKPLAETSPGCVLHKDIRRVMELLEAGSHETSAPLHA